MLSIEELTQVIMKMTEEVNVLRNRELSLENEVKELRKKVDALIDEKNI